MYGTGRVVRPDAPEWAALRGAFGDRSGVRAIIVVDVGRVADSCGYAVPYPEPAGERTMLDDRHARERPQDGPPRVARTTESIGGLPALKPDHPVPAADVSATGGA